MTRLVRHHGGTRWLSIDHNEADGALYLSAKCLGLLNNNVMLLSSLESHGAPLLPSAHRGYENFSAL